MLSIANKRKKKLSHEHNGTVQLITILLAQDDIY